MQELQYEEQDIMHEDPQTISVSDDDSLLFRKAITSYGADFDVEGLVNRIERNDIFIPHFQRRYVWSIHQASLFIESLLLGLPVPGIFLARDSSTQKLLVIDGRH